MFLYYLPKYLFLTDMILKQCLLRLKLLAEYEIEGNLCLVSERNT